VFEFSDVLTATNNQFICPGFKAVSHTEHHDGERWLIFGMIFLKLSVTWAVVRLLPEQICRPASALMKNVKKEQPLGPNGHSEWRWKVASRGHVYRKDCSVFIPQTYLQ